MTTPTQIELRSDTAANWTSNNPVLAQGEIGVVSGSNPQPFKVGDGVTTWTSLPLAVSGQVVTQQAGATYAFALADAGTVVESTYATGATFTIPLNSSVAFAVPTEITALDGPGSGVLTVTGAAGVTLNGVSGGSVATTGAYQAITLIQTAANVWIGTAAGSGAVSSVFTRTGAVTAQSGDYTVAQVTGAAPLASPALTGTPTINGAKLTYVGPSGDTTGVTDTAAFAAVIAAGGIVALDFVAATYYLTNISLAANTGIIGPGHTLATILNGSSASGGYGGGSAIYIPATVVSPVFLSGFTLNGQFGVYNYGINFVSPASFVSDWPVMNDVWVMNLYGVGLFYGGNRGGLAGHDVAFTACTSGGCNLSGSDVAMDHLTVSYNTVYGLSVSGSMVRVSDMDCYENIGTGTIVHIQQVFIERASFDQNGGVGLIVDSGAGDVYVSGRFTSNGLATTATYPHADIHAAGALGVTFMPDCFFAGLEFGHTQTTTYDVYTAGVSYYDYSQYGSSSSASGHTDLANFHQYTATLLMGSIAGTILSELSYNPSGNNTYTTSQIPSTLVAVDATNLKPAFIVPISGRVWVTWDACMQSSANGDQISGGVIINGTGYLGGLLWGFTTAGRVSCRVLVTGLTAGASYTAEPAWFVSGGGTATINYGSGSNGAGAVNVTVTAA